MVTRFKLDNMFGCRFDSRVRFDNLVGCRLVTSEVNPTNTLAGLQEQGPQQKAKATIPTDNTSEAASDSLPLKVSGRERATNKDLTELGAEVYVFGIHISYRRARSGAVKFSTISVEVPVTRFRFNN